MGLGAPLLLLLLPCAAAWKLDLIKPATDLQNDAREQNDQGDAFLSALNKRRLDHYTGHPYWNCDGSCNQGCDDSCTTSCNTGCDACDHGCDGSCDSSCDFIFGDPGCDGSCDSGCDDSCYSCDTNCDHGCTNGCDEICDHDCTFRPNPPPPPEPRPPPPPPSPSPPPWPNPPPPPPPPSPPPPDNLFWWFFGRIEDLIEAIFRAIFEPIIALFEEGTGGFLEDLILFIIQVFDQIRSILPAPAETGGPFWEELGEFTTNTIAQIEGVLLTIINRLFPGTTDFDSVLNFIEEVLILFGEYLPKICDDLTPSGSPARNCIEYIFLSLADIMENIGIDVDFSS